MGSQNRVGRSELFCFANLVLVDSSLYGRIFLLYVNISFANFLFYLFSFFPNNSIKKIGSRFQIRVGRETRNRSIFWFGLISPISVKLTLD